MDDDDFDLERYFNLHDTDRDGLWSKTVSYMDYEVTWNGYLTQNGKTVFGQNSYTWI